MKLTVSELLEQIREGLQVTDDVEKRQWLLGAQSALTALDCNRETMQGVMWENEYNSVVGTV